DLGDIFSDSLQEAPPHRDTMMRVFGSFNQRPVGIGIAQLSGHFFSSNEPARPHFTLVIALLDGARAVRSLQSSPRRRLPFMYPLLCVRDLLWRQFGGNRAEQKGRG